MNSETNTQTSIIATFIAAVVFWLAGNFAPELMSTAPAGLEAGLAGFLIVVIGYMAPKDLMSAKK